MTINSSNLQPTATNWVAQWPRVRVSLSLSILQIRFTSSGKVTETSIWPLATDLSEFQAEWPRFPLLPFVFPVLPLLIVFLLKFLFIFWLPLFFVDLQLV